MSKIIEKFCYKMPADISRPMFNEYNNRLREIRFIVDNRPAYSSLKEDFKTIELILALSVFYKRVIANIHGATVFASSVFKYSNADAVKVGSYDLTVQEKNRILAVTIGFNKMIEKYKISHNLITTPETRDLIRKIKNLKFKLAEEEKNSPNPNEPF